MDRKKNRHLVRTLSIVILSGEGLLEKKESSSWATSSTQEEEAKEQMHYGLGYEGSESRQT